jgi:hypothetical protein
MPRISLMNLTDETKVRVEKIGSASWYRCWGWEDVGKRKNVVA